MALPPLDGNLKILRPLNPFALAGRAAHVFEGRIVLEGRIAMEGGANEARVARMAINRMSPLEIKTCVDLAEAIDKRIVVRRASPQIRFHAQSHRSGLGQPCAAITAWRQACGSRATVRCRRRQGLSFRA
jgi:hypothetical protein